MPLAHAVTSRLYSTILTVVGAHRCGTETARTRGYVRQDHGILAAMAPWTLSDIESAFRASWAADTCSPDDVERAGWQADNPAWGHCDVTALLLGYMLGGDLMVGDVHLDGVQHGFHWWNRLSSGIEIDLTREQFRDGQIVTAPRVVKRPTGRPARRYEEYKLLRARVSAHLGPLPGPPDDEASLVGLIRSNEWLLRVLTAVRDEHIPDAWVGAGVLRDLVWGERYGSGFSPERVHDVDVAFFDPHDLSRSNDDRVTERLGQRLPDVPWEARNQAAVHTWYPDKFGGDQVEPSTSTHDALATWPETATAVAVRLGPDDTIEISAPFGLDDLLDGVWRRNPRRVSLERSLARLERHQPQTRWPGVTVIPPQ